MSQLWPGVAIIVGLLVFPGIYGRGLPAIAIE
jgi:hypothetical protein